MPPPPPLPPRSLTVSFMQFGPCESLNPYYTIYWHMKPLLLICYSYQGVVSGTVVVRPSAIVVALAAIVVRFGAMVLGTMS